MSAVRAAVSACAVAGAGLMLAVVTAGAALAGTARVAAPAPAAAAASPAATALPASGTACTTKIEAGAFGYYDICFRIDGQGLHIEKATAWMVNHTISYEFFFHFEIIGPSGHIMNCDEFNVRASRRSPDCSWDPHAEVPAGRYCAKLWQQFFGPPPYRYYQVGINTCIDVRP